MTAVKSKIEAAGGPQAFVEAAECLRTLAHPVRLRMVRLLLHGRYTVGELTEDCDVPDNVASKQSSSDAALWFFTSEREGRHVLRMPLPSRQKLLKGILSMLRLWNVIFVLGLAFQSVPLASAQDKSVNPGINDSFRDPDPQEFLGRFEVESREVFARRNEIVAACCIQPGQTVADIGAGTGLFSRMFSEAAGKDGRVIAVDISQKFLDHIQKTSRDAGQQNVETLLCTADSTELPAESVDVAFICDVYHHFEFPFKTMASYSGGFSENPRNQYRLGPEPCSRRPGCLRK